MPRNPEKDIREEALRREQILEAGLALFSGQGIESVSMNAVAAAAGVGPTTLFKYFQTKERLVISISAAAWKRVWENVTAQYGAEKLSKATAYELIHFYTDWMILLYQQQPALLRFSGDYKTFLCRRHTQAQELREHLEPLQPIRELFHAAYLRAAEDCSIRTDVPEEAMFVVVAIGMLSAAERYAQGIIWAGHTDADYIGELRLTQEMILSWCAGKKDASSERDARKHRSPQSGIDNAE